MKTVNVNPKFLVLMAVLLATFTACDELNNCDDTALDTPITEIKEGSLATGDTVTLQGYFIGDHKGGAILLNDYAYLKINMPIPEDQYIRLNGSFLSDINVETYQGAFVSLEGVVENSKDENDLVFTEMLGEQYLIEIHPIATPHIVLDRPIDFIDPYILINICEIHPFLCEFTFFLEQKYALLYSGGYNSSSAYQRYWNDLNFMYLTLKSKYGFTDENIIVVYKDGVGENNSMPVDYAASQQGLADAFNDLQSRSDQFDQLFVFVTNHGGGYHAVEDRLASGVNDTNGDETDTYKVDETIFYYNESNSITDDQWNNFFNSINYNELIFVLEPCFSGGFLRDLGSGGNNRIVMSAAHEFEYSWAHAGTSYAYDEFSYHFTSAINGAKHNGAFVNADSNGDGKVSMLEAFNYASTNDSAAETPMYEDSGDGVGTVNPSIGGSDGAFGATVFLN